jgi:hypothetical protein
MNIFIAFLDGKSLIFGMSCLTLAAEPGWSSRLVKKVMRVNERNQFR